MSATAWMLVGIAVWVVTYFGSYLYGHSVGSREGYLDGMQEMLGRWMATPGPKRTLSLAAEVRHFTDGDGSFAELVDALSEYDKANAA